MATVTVRVLFGLLFLGCCFVALFISNTYHAVSRVGSDDRYALDSGVVGRLRDMPRSIHSLEQRILILEQALHDIASGGVWRHALSATFEPGILGIAHGITTGQITDVVSGGQGERQGVKVGWYLDTVGGQTYTKDVLDALKSGNKPFTITFRTLVPPPSQISEARLITAPDSVESNMPRAGAGRPDPGGQAPTTTTAIPTRYRRDLKCGKMAAPLSDGRPVECNPNGDNPCCSALGWCGSSYDHCSCKGCVSYSAQQRADAALSSQSGVRNLTARSTVVVIIPFRDREMHLVEFKKYWRWFAKEGFPKRTASRWVIYIVEQFDSLAFSRGWDFNVGLAIVGGLLAASPEITSNMKENFDCAVVQDIDYLPERGVDYANCSEPTQLSSEIDRYEGRVPYLTSAGGIVAMTLSHWTQINGFSNKYFGWGGEDDELHHRLRLNKLLYGGCYPFCWYEGATHRIGQSIRRPPQGAGRFSGKYMHSMNHTKRITDSKAYANNVKLLQEIENNGNRWKSDGLSSLAFRIIDMSADTSDFETYGITYHHVKARRGKGRFNLREIRLAVPANLCSSPDQSHTDGWTISTLGAQIPWDLQDLRSRTASMLSSTLSACPGAVSANFILVDRRQHFAKVFSDDSQRLLIVYYRSLQDPDLDALIIADARPKDKLLSDFTAAASLSEPASEYTVCTSPLPKEGPKYSLHEGSACAGGGWHALPGGTFHGFPGRRDGLQPLSFCDNEKHWTQRFVPNATCPSTWADIAWTHAGTLWVPRGNEFCIGSRVNDDKDELSFSRILSKRKCGGGGYTHDASFGSAGAEVKRESITVTVCRDRRTKTANITTGSGCASTRQELLVRFPAYRTEARGLLTGPLIEVCVEATHPDGDFLLQGGLCGGREKFAFIVPAKENGGDATVICTGANHKGTRTLGFDAECGGQGRDGIVNVELRFAIPSLLSIAESTPVQSSAGGGGPAVPALYSILEEGVPCFSFLCPKFAGSTSA